MSTDEILVLAGGIAAIVWINWYFMFAGRGEAAEAEQKGGVQKVDINVEGGYEPSTVRVRAGIPVRIDFHRTESSNCSEEVVFPDFNLRRFLPAFEHTVVEVTPKEAGEYEFTCGMGMLRGRMIVEAN